MATPASRKFLTGEFKNTKRVCRVCGKERTIRMFHITGKHRSWICTYCWRERSKEHVVSGAGTLRSCSECGKETKRIIRGKCKTCYSRELSREMSMFNKSLYGRTSGCYHDQRYRRAKVARARLKLRQNVIKAYGGRCVCCGEARWDCLTIHHVNGNGREEAKLIGGGGYILYRDLRRRGYPKDGYQLLCMNCNAALSLYGYCPHQDVSVRHHSSQYLLDKSQGVRYTVKVRTELISAYGGCCSICGENNYEFLTVDHIAGDGKVDRENGLSGMMLYLWLRRNSFPRDRYRLLCMNCNHALGTQCHSRSKWQRGHRSKDVAHA